MQIWFLKEGHKFWRPQIRGTKKKSLSMGELLNSYPNCRAAQNHLFAKAHWGFLRTGNIFQLYLTTEFFWNGESHRTATLQNGLWKNTCTTRVIRWSSHDWRNLNTSPAMFLYGGLTFVFLVLSLIKKCARYFDQWKASSMLFIFLVRLPSSLPLFPWFD
jgi:hypothetical protein